MGLLTVMLTSLLASLAIRQALPLSDCTVDGPDMLTSSLSSVGSGLERTDFSVVPGTAVSLSVVCTQPDVGSLPPAASPPSPASMCRTARLGPSMTSA